MPNPSIRIGGVGGWSSAARQPSLAPSRAGDEVKIVDLRTGRTLVDKLSASEVGPHMHARIRQVCKDSGISEAAAERIVANYTKTGFQPFMFEVVK